ncbi:hypothetical protein EIN_175900 [Entamoeba invadens IP1]|uniref:hypothetical protein n=1 Tax=Entamoeba invadens IP1 TaxID=370355 RepID=UPI0002C3EDCC|nr:hypothetical protein EIN_175900 [Entamoeba invadens IP1]ELP93803.1 hypothetical protein EIN_175900 [Entamoeba invadens IP1]|eukprot:XP_004260574.1 hypothetical protein EIN_175900 [Entamoeba invadens IP1]
MKKGFDKKHSQKGAISSTLNDVTDDLDNINTFTEIFYGQRSTATLSGQNVEITRISNRNWTAEEIQKYFTLQSEARFKGMKYLEQPIGLYQMTSADEELYWGVVSQITECTLFKYIFERKNTMWKNQKLTLTDKFELALNCTEAVTSLHRLNQIHGTLGIDCFYLDDHKCVTLEHFGLPPKFYRKCQLSPTPSYESDILQLGVVIYQIFTEEYIDIDTAKSLPTLPRQQEEIALSEAREDEVEKVKEELKNDDQLQNLKKTVPFLLEKLLADAWNSDPFQRPTAEEFLIRMVDSSLVSECGGFWGADFWVYALNENGVIPEKTMPFDTFASKVAASSAIPIADIKETEKLLGSGGQITTTEFGRAVFIFDDFYMNSEKMQDIVNLCKDGCLMFVDSKEAQAKLNGCTDGVFLIRPSKTDPNAPFTLSKRTDGKTVHTRISKKEGLFVIETKAHEYKNMLLMALIEDLKTNKVITTSVDGGDSIY